MNPVSRLGRACMIVGPVYGPGGINFLHFVTTEVREAFSFAGPVTQIVGHLSEQVAAFCSTVYPPPPDSLKPKLIQRFLALKTMICGSFGSTETGCADGTISGARAISLLRASICAKVGTVFVNASRLALKRLLSSSSVFTASFCALVLPEAVAGVIPTST